MGHVGVMPVFGKSLLQAFPPAQIRPGDVFICNDPWLANGQTADVFITTPAFVGETLIGFSINSVHHMDIGGRKGSSLSEEVYEEGLIIPHLRLYREGRPNQDLLDLLRRNVRFSEKVIGDIRAQIAAGHVGVRRLEAMARDYRLSSLQPLADEITRRSETGIRLALAELPDGSSYAEIPVEVPGVGRDLKVALTLTIRGDQLEADFAGTSPQVRRPVNSPLNYTRAYVVAPTKLVCDPHLPNNEGTYRPITIKAPEGCLVNPSYPAATFWRLSIGQLVGELMFRIFAEMTPSRVPADFGAVPTWQFYINGARRDGSPFALHQHAFGGMGRGPAATGSPRSASPITSATSPSNGRSSRLRLSSKNASSSPISGGAGQWRGGLAEELVITAPIERGAAPDQPLLLSGSAGRMRNPAQGLLGGAPGSLAAIEIGGAALEATASPAAAIEPGQRLRFLLPGRRRLRQRLRA